MLKTRPQPIFSSLHAWPSENNVVYLRRKYQRKPYKDTLRMFRTLYTNEDVELLED